MGKNLIPYKRAGTFKKKPTFFTNKSKDILRQRTIERENFGLKSYKRHTQQLNQELIT